MRFTKEHTSVSTQNSELLIKLNISKAISLYIYIFFFFSNCGLNTTQYNDMTASLPGRPVPLFYFILWLLILCNGKSAYVTTLKKDV